ncbi:MAG: dephospho-CoA kinase [Syntrophobacteraceae bacterium]|nr:dephospho-CoA kinase [Syntrophobacteraceae bacterium]
MNSAAPPISDKKIALTGGIATGKTTVANRLRELGAIILDADEYARRAVEPGRASHAALREFIGEGFFHPDGALKRGELRRRIIREPELLAGVNAIVHPAIAESMREEWERLKGQSPGAVIVFDIPLLFEGGREKSYDIIILVYSTRAVQLKRLMERDGLSLSEAERTLSIQLPIDFKRERSDYIIENSEELQATLRQVEELWGRLWRL